MDKYGIVQSLIGHGIEKEGSEINEIVKLGVYIFNELTLDTPNGSVVGIGKKGKDNGLLVLVAIEEREWRIEVGSGLEGDITDIESNLIAQKYLVPKFQEGEYGEGLYDTVVALSQEIPATDQSLAIRGRYFYENVNQPPKDEVQPWVIILITTVGILMIAVILVIVYLVKKGKIKREKFKGWERGGRGARKPSSGPKGGGGRSGVGGAKGKW